MSRSPSVALAALILAALLAGTACGRYGPPLRAHERAARDQAAADEAAEEEGPDMDPGPDPTVDPDDPVLPDPDIEAP